MSLYFRKELTPEEQNIDIHDPDAEYLGFTWYIKKTLDDDEKSIIYVMIRNADTGGDVARLTDLSPDPELMKATLLSIIRKLKELDIVDRTLYRSNPRVKYNYPFPKHSIPTITVINRDFCKSFTGSMMMYPGNEKIHVIMTFFGYGYGFTNFSIYTNCHDRYYLQHSILKWLTEYHN